MKRVVGAAWLLAGLLPAVAAAQNAPPAASAASPMGARYAIVVQGASGEPLFAEQHRAWLDSLVKTLRDNMKIDPANLTVLAEQPKEGEVRATAEEVRTVLGRLAKQTKSTDVVFIMLIGHGTADATQAKFNLVGPDLGVADWDALLDPIQARVAFVNSTSGSFPFLTGLTGDRRIVITATNSLAQRYHTVFAGPFIQALSSTASDLDKNGRISMWEAFSYASRLVRQHYEQSGQLQTERPVIEDNGDGKGREAMANGEDGTLATMTYIDAVIDNRPTDPQIQMLLQRQELLTLQVDELKRRKLMMPPAEYNQAWEALMIDLALISRDVRRRMGGTS